MLIINFSCDIDSLCNFDRKPFGHSDCQVRREDFSESKVIEINDRKFKVAVSRENVHISIKIVVVLSLRQKLNADVAG